jgi:excisionase family DNA binding protein
MLNVATSALQEAYPELSPNVLFDALRQYGQTAAPDTSRRFLTPREFAKIVGASEHSAKRWCQTGKVRAVKVGSTWRIPASAVEALLSAPAPAEG